MQAVDGPDHKDDEFVMAPHYCQSIDWNLRQLVDGKLFPWEQPSDPKRRIYAEKHAKCTGREGRAARLRSSGCDNRRDTSPPRVSDGARRPFSRSLDTTSTGPSFKFHLICAMEAAPIACQSPEEETWPRKKSQC